MSYLKAIAVGIVASISSIAAIFACATIWAAWLFRNTPPPEGGAWAIDLVSVFKNLPYHWLIVSFCFAVGFIWEIRRASRVGGGKG